MILCLRFSLGSVSITASLVAFPVTCHFEEWLTTLNKGSVLGSVARAKKTCDEESP